MDKARRMIDPVAQKPTSGSNCISRSELEISVLGLGASGPSILETSGNSILINWLACERP